MSKFLSQRFLATLLLLVFGSVGAQLQDPFSGLHDKNMDVLLERITADPDDIYARLAYFRLIGKTQGEQAFEYIEPWIAQLGRSLATELYYQAQSCEIRIRTGAMEAGRPHCSITQELIGQTIESPIALGVARNALGYSEVRNGNPEKALDHFEAGLALVTRETDAALRVALLHNRGVSLTLYGLTDLAIESFEEANGEQGALPEDDPLPTILAYNLGYLQAQRGEHEAALASYAIVVPWLVETEQWARVYIAQTQIALSLTAEGRPEEALEVLTPWILRQDITVTPDSMAQAYLAMGQAHLSLNDDQMAENYLLEGVAIAREHENSARTRELTLAYASMLLDRGNYESAKESLTELVGILEIQGQKAGLSDALNLLAQAQAELGEFAAAYDASQRSAVAERASQSEAFDRRLASLRVSNELDVKDQQLALAQQREEAAVTASKTASVIRTGFVAGAVLVLLLIYLALSRRAKEREVSIQKAASVRLEQVVEQRTNEVKAELARRHEAEREHAALQLRVAKDDKLKSIGQLTGGVAHDFNNLMTVVLLSAEMLLPEVAGKSRKLVRDIIGATHSGRSVTRGLLAYARQQPLKPKPIDLQAYLADNKSLFSRTVGEAVRFDIDLSNAPAPAVILADEGQLTTCLLNLLFNAIEAMDGPGSISIVMSSRDMDDCVILSVNDTGRGMSASEIEQACEPFYSTKLEARGTGLGLSMVYGFVKQSGGELVIRSEPGQGATIELAFALAPANLTETSADSVAVTLNTQRYRVLLVEDEIKIREVGRDALERSGLQVTTAANGREATALLGEIESLDLLISDVVMPGDVSGPDLASKARERFHDLPVLLISGYTTDVPDDCAFLSKPFSMDELQQAVASMLEEHPADSHDSKGAPASAA